MSETKLSLKDVGIAPIVHSHYPSFGSSLRQSYMPGALPVNHSRDDPLPMGVSPERRERHMALMSRLRKNREGLEHELIMSKKHKKMMTNSSLQADLKSIAESIDKYTGKIQLLRQNISSTEKQIAKARDHRMHQKMSKGGTKTTRRNNEIMAKQIRVLEGRLEKLLEQFNSKIARNRALRERIDLVRKERSHYDGIFKKMEIAVNKFDRMANAVAAKTQKVEKQCQRERAELEKICSTREQSLTAFESKWREKHDVIETQLLNGAVKLHKERSLLSRCQKPSRTSVRKAGTSMLGESSLLYVGDSRISTDIDVCNFEFEEDGEENNNKNEGDTEDDNYEEDDDYEEDETMSNDGNSVAAKFDSSGTMSKTEMAKRRWASVHRTLLVKNQERKLRDYHELFEKLRELTGISDPMEIANEMTTAEDQMFSIFKHISEIEKEIEVENAAVHELKAAIREMIPNRKKTSGGAKRLVDDLSQRLTKVKAKATRCAEHERQATNELSMLRGPIEKLVRVASLIGVEGTPGNALTKSPSKDELAADQLQSTAAGTTNSTFRVSTVMEQLGVVEMRVRAMMARYRGSDQQSKVHRQKSTNIAEKMMTALTSDLVFSEKPLNRGDVAGVSDYDAQFIPLGVEETRAAIERYFSQRGVEKKGASGKP